MHDLCAERSCTALFNELLETLTPARKKYLNNFIDKAYGRTKAGVRNYGDGNTLGEKLTTFFLSKYSHFTEFLQDKVKLKGVITAFFKGIKQTLRQEKIPTAFAMTALKSTRDKYENSSSVAETVSDYRSLNNNIDLIPTLFNFPMNRNYIKFSWCRHLSRW
mgnify:FL=1